MLLATDGMKSVSIFIYHDIQWGSNAQIGFNLGDGLLSYTLPEALTSQTIDIDQLSNVGRMGVFAFRIDCEYNIIMYTSIMNIQDHAVCVAVSMIAVIQL